MKALRRLAQQQSGASLLSDDVLEFHAARLLLLLAECGTKGRIVGLTKLAKLDFFVRYPQFFDEACRHLNEPSASVLSTVESSMIRFRYGPWDQRYYHVLPFLESTGLVDVQKQDNTFAFVLTPAGIAKAGNLARHQAYSALVSQMKQVKKAFGQKSGSSLKTLIYELFEDEVVRRSMGEVIE
jgi:hypothetical protein